MERHLHPEHPWRVRVSGRTQGAGVLVDGRHVLTCAHVVGGEDEEVSVSSAVGRPEWTSTARVVPGSWVHRDGDTRRRDVALLALDRPVPGDVTDDAQAKLWCAPLSGGRVRAFGFPRAERYGIWADAELGGDGGRGGELGLLNAVRADGQWIEPGFSGAGVVVLDGDHVGHVIGIVVADFHNADARAAWMMPTETIREYLPDFARYVAGEPTDRLGPADGRLPGLGRGDTLRVALTKELTQLLTGGWAGTVALPGGRGTGSEWLVRLVRTADPATRAGTSEAEFTAAPLGTVLGLGAIDAAYDARGRTLTEITGYLAERFGLPPGEPDLIGRLLLREPPISLVIDGVDVAESPGALIRELLRPLAVRARSRGIRLVLGFDGMPPKTLPYDVSLNPEPLVAVVARSVSAAGAQARVAELADAEADAARLCGSNERRFREPPTLPRARAPMLAVRLAVARVTEPDPELAAIDDAAVVALSEVAAFTRRSRQLDERVKDLRHSLEVHRVRSERYFGAEDRSLGDLHDRAARALWQAPIDLPAARELVTRYVAEATARIDEDRHG